MARVKELKVLSIQEAMDNLAAVVSIDLDKMPQLGIIQNHRLVTDVDEVGPHEGAWLSGEGVEPILAILDTTYNSIHQHLIAQLKNNEVNWDDPKIRKGVQSMLEQVSASANKMDQYLANRLAKPLETKVEERKPYVDLQHFYQHRFLKSLKGGDASWEADWEDNEDSVLFEVSKTGMMDFESVRRDLKYELFSIRNEQGDTFFNDDLLRNIKLVCYESGKEPTFEDDPLLRVRAVQDRDLQATSSQILLSCQSVIEEFYQRFRNVTTLTIAQSLSEAIMALHLSANAHNLIQNTSGKSSLQYFNDFQLFLRRAMNNSEYQKLIAYPPDAKEKDVLFLLKLCHQLSFAFFNRLGGVKEEMIGLIHRCMRKGEEKEKK